MSVSDYEADQDFGPVGYRVERSEDGQPMLNAEQADEFDAKIYDDVEGLLYLGYLTSEVEIFGHTFVIKTLRRGERLACALLVKDWEETLGMGDALETAYVAACVVSLDGRPLSAALGPEEERDPLQRIRANFERVVKWYDPVVESVYFEFGNLLLRQGAAFAELEGKSSASRPAL